MAKKTEAERYRLELERLQERIRGLEALQDAAAPEKFVDAVVALAELRPAESVLQERLAQAIQEERERRRRENEPKAQKEAELRAELWREVESIMFGVVWDKMQAIADSYRRTAGMNIFASYLGDFVLFDALRRMKHNAALRGDIDYSGYPWHF